MNIPSSLKILGHEYKVIMVDLNETDTFGNCNINTNIIRLNKNKSQSQIASTLLHEIIESLDGCLQLELPHKTITSLEAGLYQALKDNKLHFDEP